MVSGPLHLVSGLSILGIYISSNIFFSRLKVEKSQFSKYGNLKIKCTATIDPIYWKSADKSIQRVEKTYYLSFWNLGKITKNQIQVWIIIVFWFSKEHQFIFSDIIFRGSVSAYILHYIHQCFMIVILVLQVCDITNIMWFSQ